MSSRRGMGPDGRAEHRDRSNPGIYEKDAPKYDRQMRFFDWALFHHLRSEGFEIQQLIRSKLGIVERIAARKPA